MQAYIYWKDGFSIEHSVTSDSSYYIGSGNLSAYAKLPVLDAGTAVAIEPDTFGFTQAGYGCTFILALTYLDGSSAGYGYVGNGNESGIVGIFSDINWKDAREFVGPTGRMWPGGITLGSTLTLTFNNVTTTYRIQGVGFREWITVTPDDVRWSYGCGLFTLASGYNNYVFQTYARVENWYGMWFYARCAPFVLANGYFSRYTVMYGDYNWQQSIPIPSSQEYYLLSGWGTTNYNPSNWAANLLPTVYLDGGPGFPFSSNSASIYQHYGGALFGINILNPGGKFNAGNYWGSDTCKVKLNTLANPTVYQGLPSNALIPDSNQNYTVTIGEAVSCYCTQPSLHPGQVTGINVMMYMVVTNTDTATGWTMIKSRGDAVAGVYNVIHYGGLRIYKDHRIYAFTSNKGNYGGEDVIPGWNWEDSDSLVIANSFKIRRCPRGLTTTSEFADAFKFGADDNYSYFPTNNSLTPGQKFMVKVPPFSAYRHLGFLNSFIITFIDRDTGLTTDLTYNLNRSITALESSSSYVNIGLIRTLIKNKKLIPEHYYYVKFTGTYKTITNDPIKASGYLSDPTEINRVGNSESIYQYTNEFWLKDGSGNNMALYIKSEPILELLYPSGNNMTTFNLNPRIIFKIYDESFSGNPELDMSSVSYSVNSNSFITNKILRNQNNGLYYFNPSFFESEGFAYISPDIGYPKLVKHIDPITKEESWDPVFDDNNQLIYEPLPSNGLITASSFGYIVVLNLDGVVNPNNDVEQYPLNIKLKCKNKQETPSETLEFTLNIINKQKIINALNTNELVAAWSNDQYYRCLSDIYQQMYNTVISYSNFVDNNTSQEIKFILNNPTLQASDYIDKVIEPDQVTDGTSRDHKEFSNMTKWSLNNTGFTFTRQYDSATQVTDVTARFESNNHERVYYKLTVAPNKTYTVSFDFCSPSGFSYYWAEPSKTSFAYILPESRLEQILRKGNSIDYASEGNLGRSIELKTDATSTFTTYEFTFNSGDNTSIYFVFDWGQLPDYVTYTFKFGNFIIQPKIQLSKFIYSWYLVIRTIYQEVYRKCYATSRLYSYYNNRQFTFYDTLYNAVIANIEGSRLFIYHNNAWYQSSYAYYLDLLNKNGNLTYLTQFNDMSSGWEESTPDKWSCTIDYNEDINTVTIDNNKNLGKRIYKQLEVQPSTIYEISFKMCSPTGFTYGEWAQENGPIPIYAYVIPASHLLDISSNNNFETACLSKLGSSQNWGDSEGLLPSEEFVQYNISFNSGDNTSVYLVFDFSQFDDNYSYTFQFKKLILSTDIIKPEYLSNLSHPNEGLCGTDYSYKIGDSLNDFGIVNIQSVTEGFYLIINSVEKYAIDVGKVFPKDEIINNSLYHHSELINPGSDIYPTSLYAKYEDLESYRGGLLGLVVDLLKTLI